MSFADLKPLPAPGHEKNELPPPPPNRTEFDLEVESAPSPPPKILEDEADGGRGIATLPPISVSASLGAHLAPSRSGSPHTPTTPTSPSGEGRSRKANPLTDLNETEKIYVEQLTGIIRKVAGAWSRSNLPPKELDTMFRSIESIYKANRSLYNKLKEIGTNPSSPKALGDLLMRWIEDLDAPYSSYCRKYCSGFDSWEPVRGNSRLPGVLATFSAACPPPSMSSSSQPPSPVSPTAGREGIWTLDWLFSLPSSRLSYYRKLYTRLLKSTTPGRSDHKLLVGALEKLDGLIDLLKARSSERVGKAGEVRSGEATSPLRSNLPEEPSHQITPVGPRVEDDDEVVISPSAIRSPPTIPNGMLPAINAGGSDLGLGSPTRAPVSKPGTESENSSARGSQYSSDQRHSHDTATSSISRASGQTISSPVIDLERRLSTKRTMDIFTMKLKSVRLQISPPQLTYTRSLRFSADAVISVTPRATNQEIIHNRGHIFLLSDLFLVCERMTEEERANEEIELGSNGELPPDMWLCYPPLAGKVLRVAEVPEQENVFTVAIMRKETLYVHAESRQAMEFMLKEFKECIEFAGSVGPVSKHPPPPMPALPGQFLPSNPRPIQPPEPSPNHSRSASPLSAQMSGRRPDSGGSGSQGATSPHQSLRMPSNGVQLSDSPLNPPPRISSAVDLSASPQSPFGPGQIIPPTRSTSVGPSSGFAPGQIMPNHTGGYPTGYAGANPQGPYGGPPGGAYPGGPPGPGRPYPGQQGLPPHNQQRSPYGLSNGPMNGPPRGLPNGPGPSRNPSNASSYQANTLRKSPSGRSLASQYEHQQPPLPPPPLPNQGYPTQRMPPELHAPQPRALLPSAQFAQRAVSVAGTIPSFDEPSPPGSPVEETPSVPTGPVTSTISAQMKCKVFLKQTHAQWKSLGSAKLKLYRQDPTNIKQLVVEADSKHSTVLISTIVLSDGVERVGKTGVAIELSDRGQRTGIVYMIQLKNEKSAGGLYDSLLSGSDRAA